MLRPRCTPLPFPHHPFPVSICVCVCAMTYAVRSQLVNVKQCKQWSKQPTSVDVFDKHTAGARWRLCATEKATDTTGWKDICHLIATYGRRSSNGGARLITLIGYCCPALQCYWNWNCNFRKCALKEIWWESGWALLYGRYSLEEVFKEELAKAL